MQQHLAHVLDTVIVSCVTLATAASTLILGAAESPDEFAELKQLLLPFLGALIMSGGIIMLNPQPDTRRITIGRAIVGLFFGVLGPQLIALMHPNLSTISLKPVVHIAAGGIIAAIAYIMSKPFTTELYKRSGDIARRQADQIEQRYMPKDKPPSV